MGGATAPAAAAAAGDRAVVFTYGTLKKGFSNHGLMQDLIRAGDATYLGAARTSAPLPLVCGPFRVPFLINRPGAGERVAGEVYAVNPRGMDRMDELEGVSRGHYERLPIEIVLIEEEGGGKEVVVEAEAYYAHRSYGAALWRRSGERGMGVYSEKEAKGYVKRNDRPKDVTFLDQIRIFVASSQN